ncbi:MAG: hypothetical protein RBU37_21770 [Myxococcota bacterium]|nr:hypothetical protein [Myxococcota bacterium]
MRYRFLIILSLCLTLSGTAVAQDAMQGVPILLSDAQIEAMSGAEQTSKAADAVADMQQVHRSGVLLLEKTRNEEQDVLKLNCVNEKLSAIKGFLKVGEKAQVRLEDAIGRADKKAQAHQLKLVLMASTRVRNLGEDMQACAGELVEYSGPTKLELDIDENVRTDNPTEVDTSDVTIDPYPDVSPFQ